MFTSTPAYGRQPLMRLNTIPINQRHDPRANTSTIRFLGVYAACHGVIVRVLPATPSRPPRLAQRVERTAPNLWSRRSGANEGSAFKNAAIGGRSISGYSMRAVTRRRRPLGTFWKTMVGPPCMEMYPVTSWTGEVRVPWP